MLVSSESLRAEETRVQQAYARRRSGYLYSRFNSAYLLEVQERERRLLNLPFSHGCESLDLSRGDYKKVPILTSQPDSSEKSIEYSATKALN
jgi:hypothetical protein